MRNCIEGGVKMAEKVMLRDISLENKDHPDCVIGCPLVHIPLGKPLTACQECEYYYGILPEQRNKVICMRIDTGDEEKWTKETLIQMLKDVKSGEFTQLTSKEKERIADLLAYGPLNIRYIDIMLARKGIGITIYDDAKGNESVDLHIGS